MTSSSRRPRGRKVNVNKIRVRDPLMVAIICGVTKAGTHRDRKKEANRKACRKGKHDD